MRLYKNHFFVSEKNRSRIFEVDKLYSINFRREFSGVDHITIIEFVVYSLYTPRMTVFDFQEKKFFCCKHFSPEKAEKMKALSFDKVDHLCCNTLFNGNKGQFIGVFAVTHDGYKLPLFKVTRKRLDLLFELLPELAEKMGHLTITY